MQPIFKRKHRKISIVQRPYFLYKINVGNAPNEDIPQILQMVAQNLKGDKNRRFLTKDVFIPVRTEPKQVVECLNPKSMNPFEYSKIRKLLNKIQLDLKKLI